MLKRVAEKKKTSEEERGKTQAAERHALLWKSLDIPLKWETNYAKLWRGLFTTPSGWSSRDESGKPKRKFCVIQSVPSQPTQRIHGGQRDTHNSPVFIIPPLSPPLIHPSDLRLIRGWKPSPPSPRLSIHLLIPFSSFGSFIHQPIQPPVRLRNNNVKLQ